MIPLVAYWWNKARAQGIQNENAFVWGNFFAWSGQLWFKYMASQEKEAYPPLQQ